MNTALQRDHDLVEDCAVGIMAGLAGTVAITISQMIEMQITERKAGTGPANAVEKTLDIYPEPGTKKRLSQQVHWTYGTMWGIVRGILSAAGINKWVATGVHFGAITGTAMAMAPLEGQKPVKQWTAKEVSVDILHHAVYAMAAGLVFDAIFDSGK